MEESNQELEDANTKLEAELVAVKEAAGNSDGLRQALTKATERAEVAE